MFRASLLTLISLLWAVATQAQTQASCTFKFFSLQTTFTQPNGDPVFLQPLGIDDFGVVVGGGYRGSAGSIGIIRWPGGVFTRIQGIRGLTARNDEGTMTGYEKVNGTWRAVLVKGQTITPILDVNNGDGVALAGINNSGTVVGTYSPAPGSYRGFKRFKNGTTHTLEFPGSAPNSTFPNGINDFGTVVGTYQRTKGGRDHGFIFHNGEWATLDYSHEVGYSGTVLYGITNAGQILGSSSDGPFLYENGIFKIISIPKRPRWLDPPTVVDISPKQGLILGQGNTTKAFIAKCQ